jgi:uncharacterized protein (TIGR02117 family)
MRGGAFTFVLRRGLRMIALALGAILGLFVLYVAAAIPGALLRPPLAALSGEPHPVYLVWSEIHTDIILPVHGRSVDWSTVLADWDTPLGPLGDGYVAFGWGSESFYKDVPTLADMTVPVVARALFFDATIMHVVPVPEPALIPPQHRRTMLLSDAQLVALEQHVLSTFTLTSGGIADALPDETYGYGDAFYTAEGRYNPLRTCNQWTSEGLRLAGQPVGVWTPFSQSITWVLGTDAEPSTAH